MRYGTVCRGKMFAQAREQQVSNCVLGIAGEAGEIADHYKKLLYHPQSDRTPSREDLRAELGDLLWYLSALNEIVFGDSLLDVARDNIRKLAARYPEKYGNVDTEDLSL